MTTPNTPDLAPSDLAAMAGEILRDGRLESQSFTPREWIASLRRFARAYLASEKARVKAEGERDEALMRGTDASTRAAQQSAELQHLRTRLVPIHARTEDAVCNLCGERVPLTDAGAIPGALAVAPHPNTRRGPYCKGTFTYDWHHSGCVDAQPGTTITMIVRDANGACVACGVRGAAEAPDVRVANAERLRDLAQDALQDVADYWRGGLLAEQRRAGAAESRIARLEAALRNADRVMWMAKNYADGGGSGGPERRDYDEAKAAINAALMDTEG